MLPVKTNMRSANPPSAPPRGALVVAGMHRSGTSAMARMLSLAGATLPHQIIDPGPDNPLGFWEPAEMVQLNDAILESVGSRWDDVFGHRVSPLVWQQRDEHLAAARRFIASNYDDEIAILKDPRTSLMVRLWDEALRQEGRSALYIIMVRHPLEVAASVAARGNASQATAVLIWAAYMLAVERDTRGLRRIFVDYDDLLTDWRIALDRIQAASGLKPTENAESEIDAFLSSEHRHHQRNDVDLAACSNVWPEAENILSWMREAATGAEPSPRVLDVATAELDRVAEMLEPALHDLRREAGAFPALRMQLADARKEIDALRALCDQFHADADHNGRHWEASRDMVTHLTQEVALAREESEAAKQDAGQTHWARRELALAESRYVRLRSQNWELMQVLAQERNQAEAARIERASAQDYIAQLTDERDRLAAEIAEARRDT